MLSSCSDIDLYSHLQFCFSEDSSSYYSVIKPLMLSFDINQLLFFILADFHMAFFYDSDYCISVKFLIFYRILA